LESQTRASGLLAATIYRLVAQASGIRFAFDREDRQNHANTYTFYLNYQGPLPAPNSVKVDITIAEARCFPIEQRPVLRAYPEFNELPEDRAISVYSLNEIATEKVVALLAAPSLPFAALFLPTTFQFRHNGSEKRKWKRRRARSHSTK
jgi:Nucleotidyl transferase AbiEii toxin, Type IV TA system